jgi:hypothetical protein
LQKFDHFADRVFGLQKDFSTLRRNVFFNDEVRPAECASRAGDGALKIGADDV